MTHTRTKRDDWFSSRRLVPWYVHISYIINWADVLKIQNLGVFTWMLYLGKEIMILSRFFDRRSFRMETKAFFINIYNDSNQNLHRWDLFFRSIKSKFWLRMWAMIWQHSTNFEIPDTSTDSVTCRTNKEWNMPS